MSLAGAVPACTGGAKPSPDTADTATAPTVDTAGTDTGTRDPSVWVGDVTLYELPGFCDGHATRAIDGNLYVQFTEIPDLRDLSCLTSVSGDVEIWDARALTSMAGLEQLTTVGGSLTILDSDGLQSLEGLESLTSVGSGFGISDNDQLASITALRNLESVESLGLHFGPELTSLAGLEGLRTIPGGLGIEGPWGDTPSLTSFAGLHNVESVGWLRIQQVSGPTSLDGFDRLSRIDGDATLYLSTTTVSLSGFSSLRSVGALTILTGGLTSLAGLENLAQVGDFDIEGNFSLTSLAGLAGLTAVDGHLHLRTNGALTSLSGLEGVRSIAEELVIEDHVALTDLTALYELESVGGDVTIVNNAGLGDPAAQALVDEIDTIGGTVTVAGN